MQGESVARQKFYIISKNKILLTRQKEKVFALPRKDPISNEQPVDPEDGLFLELLTTCSRSKIFLIPVWICFGHPQARFEFDPSIYWSGLKSRSTVCLWYPNGIPLKSRMNEVAGDKQKTLLCIYPITSPAPAPFMDIKIR